MFKIGRTKKDATDSPPLSMSKIQPRFVIIIAIILLFTLFLSAFYELSQTKQEIIQLQEEEATALMESIIHSGANAIYSFHQIEDLIEEKLFSVARLIDRLEQETELSPQQLAAIALENDVYRINIFNSDGKHVMSSFQGRHDESLKPSPDESYFRTILEGKEEEKVIGFRDSRHKGEQRFAVAIKRSKGGAIVVNIDAAEILEFRKSIGVGRLMQDINDYQGIEYIALQDTQGILVASGVDSLSTINSDPFLKDALKNETISSRFQNFGGRKIFEFVRPFILYDEPVGLFRIGLKTDRLDQANDRMKRRLFIMSIVMGLFILIAINFLTINQNYHIIDEAYRRIKTYSSNILEHMADAVIALSHDKRILIFNSAASKLFNTQPEDVINKPCREQLSTKITPLIDALEQGKTVRDLEQTIHLDEKRLITAISTSVLTNSKGEIDSAFAVIKDLTERHVLEETIRRKEKLTAMGQLASGVAHEIRNPLNAIGMISQRLHKEFEPKADSEEYRELTKTVVGEVHRINEIIQQFLKFARPAKPDLSASDINVVIDEAVILMSARAKEQNIKILKNYNPVPSLFIDRNQMKQAFLNLLQNAMEAIAGHGEIHISTNLSTDEIVKIEISDNGMGMDSETKSKIFNLYFTTKPTGTGLGLSLVHQIISQHNGQIDVASEPGVGTTFTIYLPTAVQGNKV